MTHDAALQNDGVLNVAQVNFTEEGTFSRMAHEGEGDRHLSMLVVGLVVLKDYHLGFIVLVHPAQLKSICLHRQPSMKRICPSLMLRNGGKRLSIGSFVSILILRRIELFSSYTSFRVVLAFLDFRSGDLIVPYFKRCGLNVHVYA